MADNRIKITSIKIKNFRSIRNCSISPRNLNIFVGLNDAGKSNVLKALNLFFNNETDYGVGFSFERDFTFLYKRESHAAKEISIIIKFLIPDSYQSSGEYTWTKVWKSEGLIDDLIVDSFGNKTKPNSRIPGALKRIKYRYVPAVKSRTYFRALLGDLYKAVFSSLNNPLEESVNAFSEELRKYTTELSEDIKKQLGISSLLSFPNDLNDVFKALIFETTCNTNDIKVPLEARGDGIQAIHIPIILKYIAHEDQKSRQKGSMRISTFWGFEEPENGLELSKSFKLSDEFMSYSSEIQIFVSTHSPAFYTKQEDERAIVFYVSKKPNEDETVINEKIGQNMVAENMGLMPLVAPYIQEQALLLEKLKEFKEKDFLIDTPTILVEGETDIEYLKIAINCHSPFLKQKIENNSLRIVCKKDGEAGCGRLADWFLAWMLTGFRSKMFALLDDDEAGKKTKNDILQHNIYIEKQNSTNVKVGIIKPSQEILNYFTNGIIIDFEIEHLLSNKLWKKIISKGYAQERKLEYISKTLIKYQSYDKTINDILEEIKTNKGIDETLLRYEPDDYKKGKILKLLKDDNDQSSATLGFKKTIDELESFLEVRTKQLQIVL